MSNCIIVLAKNPELGKVKTRLAATVGDENALMIYEHILNHAEQVLIEANEPVAFYFTSDINSSLFSKIDGQRKLQSKGDLGLRMKTAFQDQFENGKTKVVIIGTDCYQLSANHIQQAFNALEQNDVVIGPANDGGYYLLGMNTFIPEIFENIAWSTEKVLTQTLDKLKQGSRTYRLLEELVDVDNESELGELKHLIKEKP